jgi:lysine 2,3-aminomutase
MRETETSLSGEADRPPSAEGEFAEDKPPSLVRAACAPAPAALRVPAADGMAASAPSGRSRPRVLGFQWEDWRWQMRRRIRGVRELRDFFPEAAISPSLEQAAARFPLAITPYYASLVQEFAPTDPIYRMCVPQVQELNDPPFLRDDPLEEEEDTPVPGLVHRYRDRALVIATTTCSVYCRHCTRKRVAGSVEQTIFARQLARSVAYLTAHPEIKDVIVSGGDPLTMSTDRLEKILAAIRAVPSVEILRVGTRTPVVLPQRITDGLVEMLRRHAPLYVNTHFNHPRELTDEARGACARLVDAGIPVNNQSVHLRGVNDDPAVMEDLVRGLLRMRVRPYYLYQCDLVRGVEHFRTPLSRGIQIMEYLRGRVSGLGIPTFVVDAPQGGGKIPVLPNYLISTSPTHTVLRNFEGMMFSYPEPDLTASADGPPAEEMAGPTVADLAAGKAAAIKPAKSDRLVRRAKKEPAES